MTTTVTTSAFEVMQSQLVAVAALILIVKYHKKFLARLWWRGENANDNNKTTSSVAATTPTTANKKSILDQILTIPNIITMSRVACIPYIIYYIHTNDHLNACLLFCYAAVSDFLDGYIARNWPGQSSIIGGILDPLADKLLVGSLAITFTITGMLPIGKRVLLFFYLRTLIKYI